ncbi:hypothetical protein Trydic_g23093 [Trypoxylus dichotomus]
MHLVRTMCTFSGTSYRGFCWNQCNYGDGSAERSECNGNTFSSEDKEIEGNTHLIFMKSSCFAIAGCRNKDYLPQHMKEVVPFETSQRSLILTEAIRNKIEEFFMSRLIQVRIGDAVEARKKGGGIFGGGGGGGGGKKGGGGGMLILIGVAMAGVLTQLFMGKIALAAGAALLLAKIALTVTLVSSFKKTSNNGGGKESAHVVYAPGGSDGYSHGYGGWHRSMVYEEDPQKIAYNGYAQQSAQYH